MEIQQVIETIVRELVHTMHAEQQAQPKPHQLLYVFCDGTAHEAYTDHFIRLDDAGLRYDMMFLDGEACAWLGAHKIEARSSCKVIAADDYAPAPIELVKQYDGVVIPEIDLDGAARAAQGLKGSVKAEIIFAALVLGKFVLIGDESPGLNRADRRTLGKLTLSQPYAKLFASYRRQLSELGAVFVPCKQLAEKAIAQCNIVRNEWDSQVLPIDERREKIQCHTETESIFADVKLVTVDWLYKHLPKGWPKCLKLNRRSIVSPLAKDVLRENGVAVHYVDER